MHPAWSIITKIFVALGCKVSILVGFYGTRLIGHMWHLHDMPGLPCPVVCFSMYTIIVDFIMNYRTMDCIDI
ncbi:unnamed protein product [Rotaria sp. Silwood2]|nr:unnamed protein product [Rotaria sp. Silwood2]CAF4405143.1 unnamed protein product [Rotaria sp. Silwood2]